MLALKPRPFLLLTAVATVCVLLTGFGSASSQTPSAQKVIAIRAAWMIDPSSPTPVAKPIILVEGDRIREAGPAVVVPADADVIDLGSATVLPGLIDCHTHLLENYNGALGGDDPNMILTVVQLGTTRRALLGAAMGREDLESGITTVRDLGNSGWNGDVALRDAIDRGWVVGPRIVASTRALSAAGGQFGGVSAETQKIIENEYVVISGVEEARRAVRQAFYDGADCIKVIVDTWPRVVSLDELKVIVEEAHRVNKKVAAHAVTDAAVKIAAQAGVDSVEHGYLASDEALKMMAEKKVFLVPTDYPWTAYLEFGSKRTMTPEERKQAEAGVKRCADANHRRLERARTAGVRIAAGSDEYYQFPGRTRGEASLLMLKAYAASGMSPLEIIQAATINAAELLGWQWKVGTLEKGKLADIIAVEGDPLKDIDELSKVKFVMKGGRVIKNELKKK